MASSVRELLEQHSENPVKNTGYSLSSNKTWAKSYPPIKKLRVHTFVDENGGVQANFDDAFLGMYEDDDLRLEELAYPPNYRQWRLVYEEDVINWFHTEVSDVALAAWARYPAVMQASHEKPLTDTKVAESVDVAYSVKRGRERVHMAIGEFKRCLVSRTEWQSGKLMSSHQVFSRELRGTFLMLQFRAAKLDAICDPDCTVDCWVFPRNNPNGMSLRFAFYRLLAQGFRRCQGLWSLSPTLYNIAPDRREFYNGRPLWRIDGGLVGNPWGHQRRVDPGYGAFYWTDAEGSEALVDEVGQKVWDTLNCWEPEQADAELVNLGSDLEDMELGSPILIQDRRPEERVLFRLSCPNQAIFPEEKTEAEAATVIFLAEFTNLPVHKLFHQAADPDLGPYMIIQDLGTRRCMSEALEAPRDNPDVTPILNPDISETNLRRLYTKMARCVFKLAQPTFPRIGALVETGPGVFQVLGRPITLNMTKMVQLSNIPTAMFPPKGTTYQTADEWYVALADMQLATLVFQHNDMVASEDDCRNKYVARQLFRKLAKQGRLSTFGFAGDDWSAAAAGSSGKCCPTPKAPDNAGSFRLWCDDFRPANVLVDEANDGEVLDVIDWEFTYAAPIQFALDCPWWLLLDIPEMWDAGIDDWIAQYPLRLETWLSAMEEIERDYDDNMNSEQAGGLSNSLRLSAYIRGSWSTGRFWLNYAARKGWAFDHVYWNYLDEKFFGEQVVEGEGVTV